MSCGGLLSVKTQSQALESPPVREANPEFPLLSQVPQQSTGSQSAEGTTGKFGRGLKDPKSS